MHLMHHNIVQVVATRIKWTGKRKISILKLLAAAAAIMLFKAQSPGVCGLFSALRGSLAGQPGKSSAKGMLLERTPGDLQELQSAQLQIGSVEKCDKAASGDLIVVWVDTAPANVIRRNKIRSTWGSVRQHNGTAIRTLFFLGAVNDAELQSAISSEAAINGDVVQDHSYVDTYRNLTRKGLSALRWIAAHCRNPLRVVKVDDDTLLNPFNLINFIRTSNDAIQQQFACETSITRPIRNAFSKYYVPYEEFKNDTWPLFCQGYGYMIPPSTVQQLLEAAKVVQFVSMEDVYITGIHGQFLGISHYALTKEQAIMTWFLENKFQEKIEQRRNVIFVGHAKYLLQYDVFWKVASTKAQLS